jgi:hypothetical protein
LVSPPREDSGVAIVPSLMARGMATPGFCHRIRSCAGINLESSRATDIQLWRYGDLAFWLPRQQEGALPLVSSSDPHIAAALLYSWAAGWRTSPPAPQSRSAPLQDWRWWPIGGFAVSVPALHLLRALQRRGVFGYRAGISWPPLLRLLCRLLFRLGRRLGMVLVGTVAVGITEPRLPSTPARE